MTKCIGIISWLPDDESHRKLRLESLIKTLDSCNKIFNLPIIIIAQNWKPDEIEIKSNYEVYYYEKLGIVKARKILRLKFLQSKYDRLIMLDDDCVLEGDPTNYLQAIEDHPDCIVQGFKPTQFKLFSIPKYLYEQIDLPNISVENFEGIEDEVFIKACHHKFKDKIYILPKRDLNLNLNETLQNSTWKPKDYTVDIYTKIIQNTRKLFSKFKQEGYF